jgi:FkbM family methyltransferase
MAIKKILMSVLGEKKYLSLLAGSFQRLYPTGWLGKEYQDVYFLKKIVRKGDWCIDIGAHLGYFTLELSRLTGDAGKVFAIEPMSPFHHTLQRLLQRKNARNVTLYQLALGGKGEYVEMGIPKVGAVKRFAYARIKDPASNLDFVESEKVKNETGDRLFLDLPRLDYIKCDVEGLEYEVFASMTRTLATHHPILLCELFERGQRIKLFELLRPMGYQAYTLNDGRLRPLDVYVEGTIVSQNNYFVPLQHEERLKDLGIIAPAPNPAS